MEEIIKSLLPSGLLTAILFLVAWTWFSTRLREDIKRDNDERLTEHRAKIEHEYDEKLAEHKARLDNEYDTKLATHSAQLTSANDLQLTLYRHKLEQAATEQHLRFSHVFDRTASVVESTYTKLRELDHAVRRHTELTGVVPQGQMDDSFKKLEALWDDFHKFYTQNRLFIPKATAERIRHYTISLSTFQRKSGWLQAYERSATARPALIEKIDNQLQAFLYDSPKLLAALEDDFQELLGFPTPPTERK